jgi:hypothetical protein
MEIKECPCLLYLPFGWMIAGAAEMARMTATMANGTQALTQLAIALTFLALEQK